MFVSFTNIPTISLPLYTLQQIFPNKYAMKRTILSLVTLFTVGTPTWCQQTDSLAAAMMSENRWFELQDVYRTDSMAMSPFIRLFSETMLHYVFNRSEAAADNIVNLLRHHQKEMGGATTLSMMKLLVTNLANAGNYSKAAATAGTFADQLEGAEGEIAAEFKHQQTLYDTLSRLAVCQTDTAYHEVEFLWTKVHQTDASLMGIAGKVNGRADRFVFDTGASYNVITPELADRFGLRRIQTEIAVQGTQLGKGGMAIADSIAVGEIVMHNVPFAVLDLTEGNERVVSATRDFSLILGQPFLRQYDRYTIDTDRQTICFEPVTEPADVRHNLYLQPTPHIEVEHSGKRFAITLDTGAAKTTLGHAYYKAFAPEIAREGRWDVVGMTGYGGIAYESVFRMPHIEIGIDNAVCTLDGVEVAALPSSNGLTGGYGRLGLDFLRQWCKVIIDNRNMTISVY